MTIAIVLPVLVVPVVLSVVVPPAVPLDLVVVPPVLLVDLPSIAQVRSLYCLIVV